MGQRLVYTIDGEPHNGLTIPVGLYASILATVEANKDRELPVLFDSPYDDREMDRGDVVIFGRDIVYAGELVLSNQLLSYHGEDNRVALAGTHTSTQAAVTLLTLLEVSEIARSQGDKMHVKKEDASPNHRNLSLENVLDLRLRSFRYLPGITDIRDYFSIVSPSATAEIEYEKR